MAEVPPEMLAKGRRPDPHFADDEVLYRRFRPGDIVGGEVVPEAFELPDMSVSRQKYGRPEWLVINDEFEGWGVAGFRVKDIPREQELLHPGVIAYILKPEHVPLKYNYPHSEVRVYRDGERICRKSDNLDLLDPVFHIRWRERLSQLAKVVIKPKI